MSSYLQRMNDHEVSEFFISIFYYRSIDGTIDCILSIFQATKAINLSSRSS